MDLAGRGRIFISCFSSDSQRAQGYDNGTGYEELAAVTEVLTLDLKKLLPGKGVQINLKKL